MLVWRVGGIAGGELNVKEFRRALEVAGITFQSSHSVRKLFAAFDKDSTGTVDFVEFVQMIFPDIDELELIDMQWHEKGSSADPRGTQRRLSRDTLAELEQEDLRKVAMAKYRGLHPLRKRLSSMSRGSFKGGGGGGVGGTEAAEAAVHAFKLHARVTHQSRGAGTVIELMEDGRTRIRFDCGEEHRYRPSSMHKISALTMASVSAAKAVSETASEVAAKKRAAAAATGTFPVERRGAHADCTPSLASMSADAAASTERIHPHAAAPSHEPSGSPAASAHAPAGPSSSDASSQHPPHPHHSPHHRTAVGASAAAMLEEVLRRTAQIGESLNVAAQERAALRRALDEQADALARLSAPAADSAVIQTWQQPGGMRRGSGAAQGLSAERTPMDVELSC